MIGKLSRPPLIHLNCEPMKMKIHSSNKITKLNPGCLIYMYAGTTTRSQDIFSITNLSYSPDCRTLLTSVTSAFYPSFAEALPMKLFIIQIHYRYHSRIKCHLYHHNNNLKFSKHISFPFSSVPIPQQHRLIKRP